MNRKVKVIMVVKIIPNNNSRLKILKLNNKKNNNNNYNYKSKIMEKSNGPNKTNSTISIRLSIPDLF